MNENSPKRRLMKRVISVIFSLTTMSLTHRKTLCHENVMEYLPIMQVSASWDSNTQNVCVLDTDFVYEILKHEKA